MTRVMLVASITLPSGDVPLFVQRGLHQIGCDTEIEQTRHRPGRIVRVQGGQDQMSRQRRLDRDAGGRLVADLADHDDVRVLPQQASQRGGELESHGRADLELVDAADVAFHRVFDRADVHRLAVQF